MTSFEQLSSNQKTRAALHRDIQTICAETCHFLGLEITKPAMEIVAELVYRKLSVYGKDLEAFARHAKRATINTEDVKLLVRRCHSLKTHLNNLSPAAPISKEKRRKTMVVRQPETPILKAKESEIQIPKQREPEIQISKYIDPDVPAATLKQDVEKTDDNMDKEENMSVDDEMIDLTFD